ncbi:MAG TPA: hypothetical protein V6D12_18920 [Candidatus Obscuribacterales bacterium]
MLSVRAIAFRLNYTASNHQLGGRVDPEIAPVQESEEWVCSPGELIPSLKRRAMVWLSTK